jgi:protein SCO1/2
MLRAPGLPPHRGASLEGLLDRDGHTFGRDAYHDRFKLMAFGYTHCPNACPATLVKMRLVLAAIGPLASHVAPLFVTVDPANDTPDVLGRYAQAFDPRIVAVSGDRVRLERYARAYDARPSRADGKPDTGHAVQLYLLAPDDSVVAIYALTDSTRLVANDLERRLTAGAASAIGPNVAGTAASG